jgi:hypothetical protein
MKAKLVVLLVLALIIVPFAGVATAKPKLSTASLMLPLAGASSTGATFRGTVTVNRFVAGAGTVVAEGVVSGTLTGAGGVALGTALQAPVTFPVTGNWGGIARRAPGNAEPAAMSGDLRGRIILAQSCGVLHLELGAVDLDLLGVTVTTSPVAVDISGDAAGPLGGIVCAVLGLVGTVAGLVNLLNGLLGALTGIVGGVV